MKKDSEYTLVDSLYINNSGGQILLEYLLKTICNSHSDKKIILLLDKRFNSIYLRKFSNTYFVSPSEYNRYIKYKYLLNKYYITKIFTFNNLPPPFKISPKIIVNIYFHNLNFVQDFKFKNILNYFKFSYIRILNKSSYHWIVQTNFTKNILKQKICNSIQVIPFFNNSKIREQFLKKYDFIYVASAAKQKNHKKLLLAWNALSSKNLFPSLILTIDINCKNNENLIQLINSINLKGGNIINLGVVNHDIIHKYYLESRCLIFPSLFESFGLPLLEAVNYNLPIIGSDLEYLNEVIDTKYVFNPFFVDSIVNLISKILENIDNLNSAKLRIDNKIHQLIKIIC